MQKNYKMIFSNSLKTGEKFINHNIIDYNLNSCKNNRLIGKNIETHSQNYTSKTIIYQLSLRIL